MLNTQSLLSIKSFNRKSAFLAIVKYFNTQYVYSDTD